jgi:hypothetical protein
VEDHQNELCCLENSSAVAQAIAAGAPDFRFSGGSQSLKSIRNLEDWYSLGRYAVRVRSAKA